MALSEYDRGYDDGCSQYSNTIHRTWAALGLKHGSGRTIWEIVAELKSQNERLKEALTPFATWARLHRAADPGDSFLAAPAPEIAPDAIYTVSWAVFLNAIEVIDSLTLNDGLIK